MIDRDKFFNISENIGNDFSLVQGPGGNTSYKNLGKITIKKSGSFLNSSKTRNIFIEEDITKLLKFYENIDTNEKYSKGLSIETPLHIIFDQNYVFHYHSILSIILSVNFEIDMLKSFCEKNGIIWVPYKRPGVELAREIKNIENIKDVNIFFLQNHGMLITSDNLNDVEEIIVKTEKEFEKLTKVSKKNIFKNLTFNKKNSDGLYEYRFENLKDLKNINNKYFFPDHAVFSNFNFYDLNEFDKQKAKNRAYFKDDLIFFNKELNPPELDILRTVLIIYTMSKKILNYIDSESGNSLYSSKDEKLRIEKNK